ncbi:DUF58 domain-containing protein [Oleiagrimonas citrea]|uniref:DUF58 domain-containing protein n=1 Tax=Oleiagrimonas citrea TaxID=1665687 RepID=A0A846ZH14_9GAMM|nr:DUF58 domain-containing protein [Oleiagrimonas citrea]NKZ37696.1 DUF58 domain-containing protein [Oleiagrimonas citrea]
MSPVDTDGSEQAAVRFARLRQRIERHLPALTRMKRPETLPIELGRRRIYILPTGFGVGFATVLLVMLVGALNYANNSALLLTCLLGGIAVNSMLTAFRDLDGLRVCAIRAEPARAGENLSVQVRLDAGGRPRTALQLDGFGGHVHASFARADESVTLSLPTRSRGWMKLPRIRASTTWPFGLFRAWSWLHPDIALLVYPAPETDGPPAEGIDEHTSRRSPRDGDELAGLRDYRAGDPIKHIAWKLSARHHDLLVRELDRPDARDARMLDWQRIRGLSYEQRIARLARWVIEAHAHGERWTLRLPDTTLGPGSGSEHYHRCMSALALLP